MKLSQCNLLQSLFVLCQVTGLWLSPPPAAPTFGSTLRIHIGLILVCDVAQHLWVLSSSCTKLTMYTLKIPGSQMVNEQTVSDQSPRFPIGLTDWWPFSASTSINTVSQHQTFATFSNNFNLPDSILTNFGTENRKTSAGSNTPFLICFTK